MWIRVTEWPNSYSISWHTFKWRKKLFFHVLDMAVLNSYSLHPSCGCKKISHRDLWYTLVRNMLVHAGPERRVPRPLDRPPNFESHVAMLEVCDSKHWPTRSETKLRCCVFKGMTKKVFVKCCKCDVGLCVWNKHVSKTAAPRHNCKNIWCDLRKKKFGPQGDM